MSNDRKTIVLRGGNPWGFRLAGGTLTPVYIAKVAREEPDRMRNDERRDAFRSSFLIFLFSPSLDLGSTSK